MPAVVMDNGGQPGSRSDHDRDPKSSALNGVATVGPGKDTAVAPPSDKADAKENAVVSQAAPPSDEKRGSRMNDLPDEIVHITEGFVPLSTLLTRLAQKSHNELEQQIALLASLPVPAAAVNGNASHPTPDNTSNENMQKKASLLKFAQQMHGKWVKALVIAEWSRKSEMVSKLIDLKWHIDQQRILYDGMLDQIVNVKRDLSFARMPSPDLKTALQVLSTGAAPWMPDLQYIELPPLDVQDQLKWMNDLNTLLSLRLNLDEFEKIPSQFRNYEIDSGRVTFKIEGEFEVDLTIADEDFEKQFWFIDFRFAFKPAAATIPETLRGYLESCVNEALAKDGLAGCYEFLHEFVMTCKINELKRQALQLSKASWTGTLKIEPLHRALAIQYWSGRLPSTNPKSWVLVAVNSGRKKKGIDGTKTTSYLEVKWYPDGKEMSDVVISSDAGNMSAESLLQDVIGRHIEFILRGIHDQLMEKPRFKNRELRVDLDISKNDPAESKLTTQVAHAMDISILVEPKTGAFALRPSSRFTYSPEFKLNNGQDQIEGGLMSLEDVRCSFVEDEIARRSSPVGWNTVRPPMKDEEIRTMTKLRSWTKTLWLQRVGWPDNWFLLVVLSQGGDEWWLVDTTADATQRSGQRHQIKLPLGKGAPDHSEKFWLRLTLFASAMISQCLDLRDLYQQRIKNMTSQKLSWSRGHIKLPAIDIALSDMFPAMVHDSSRRSKNQSEQDTMPEGSSEALTEEQPKKEEVPLSPREPWAKNVITLRFNSVQPSASLETAQGDDNSAPRLVCAAEAQIKVRNPSKLASLNGRVDRNVHYSSAKAEFSLLLCHPVGESILGVLKQRIIAIDRFVCFLQALEKCKNTIKSERVSLGGVSFFYGPKTPKLSDTDGPELSQPWKVELDLSKEKVDVKLNKGNPHLRVIDLMKRLVNIQGGILALMSWLPRSMPTIEAIDDIETKWEDIQVKAQGQVEFFVKTLDWMGVRYTIKGSNNAGQPVKRQLVLEARVKIRDDEKWWHIWRLDENHSPEDRFNQALMPVWEGRGLGWQGLSNSAAGELSGGAATMLGKVDEAIRNLVGNLEGDEGFDIQPPTPAPVQPQQAPAPKPTAQKTPTQKAPNPKPPGQKTPSQQPKPKPKPKQTKAKNGKGPEQAIEIS